MLPQTPEYLELQAFTTRAGSVIDTAILSNDITSHNKVGYGIFNFSFFLETVSSLCNPGWPGTYYVGQAGQSQRLVFLSL